MWQVSGHDCVPASNQQEKEAYLMLFGAISPEQSNGRNLFIHFLVLVTLVPASLKCAHAFYSVILLRAPALLSISCSSTNTDEVQLEY